MLALTGLPTLFPKLVEARTFAERMFHVVFLDPLNEKETVEAIRKPVQSEKCPVHFSDESVKTVWNVTRGYPYFVQYVCREVFDVWVQAMNLGQKPPEIPVGEITRKLDADFFAGRWARATDRQRELSLPGWERAQERTRAREYPRATAPRRAIAICGAFLISVPMPQPSRKEPFSRSSMADWCRAWDTIKPSGPLPIGFVA